MVIGEINQTIIIGGNNMRIENKYSRKIRRENSPQKSDMISKKLQSQERKLNERMKEIENKENEAWERARRRILG